MKLQCRNKASCQDALRALLEELGSNNVKDIYFNEHFGQWHLSFFKGEIQDFDSFDDLYTWLKTEGND